MEYYLDDDLLLECGKKLLELCIVDNKYLNKQVLLQDLLQVLHSITITTDMKYKDLIKCVSSACFLHKLMKILCGMKSETYEANTEALKNHPSERVGDLLWHTELFMKIDIIVCGDYKKMFDKQRRERKRKLL